MSEMNYIEEDGEIMPSYGGVNGSIETPQDSEMPHDYYGGETSGFKEETDQPNLSREERLEVLLHNEQAGFAPTTKEEITEAMGLVSFIGTPGGTARHLNEVLLHQNKAETDDPAAAVRSITNNYTHWAKYARRDSTLLRQLDEDLINPELSLRVAVDGRDHPAFRQLVRGKVLREIAKEQLSEPETVERYGFDPLKTVRKKSGNRVVETDPFLGAEQGSPAWELVEETVDNLDVKTTKGLLKVAIKDQDARFSFWQERLKESKAHLAARPIAQAALRQFGVE